MSDLFTGFAGRVADALQEGLPLVERPYLVLAQFLGCAEACVLEAAAGLVAAGAIRSFGAFVDYERLGYEGYLCGLAVPDSAVDAVAARLNDRGEVTHNYLREGTVNVWFTALLQAGGACRLEAELRGMGHPFVLLRTVRRIKLRPCFRISEEAETVCVEAPDEEFPPSPPGLSDVEIARTLSLLQTDFPVEPRPFARMADNLGIGVGELLERLTLLKKVGILRRIGASLHHIRAGYSFNALLALGCGTPEAALAVGQALSRHPWLSHCYLRTVAANTLPRAWPYELYAMVHAKRADDLEERLATAGSEPSLRRMLVLPTVRELKKSRYRPLCVGPRSR